MANVLYEVLAEMCCREPRIRFRLGFLAWRVDNGRCSERGKTLEARVSWELLGQATPEREESQ